MRALGGLIVTLGIVACASLVPAAAGAGGTGIAIELRAMHMVASRGELAVLETLINRHRVAIGCSPLIVDKRLSAVARRHSEDMVRRSFFDHTNPDGRDPFARMRAADVRYRAAAENIAQGRALGRDTYDDWIESPGHRRNIENCEYTHMGIGLYQRTWTLELVRYAR